MKILQVISSYPPAYSYGGATRVSHDISKELVRKGHDVTVYTTDVYDEQSRLKYSENPEFVDGVKVHHFKNISNVLAKKNFAIAPSMIYSLRKNIKEFDIVHIHEYRSFQAAFSQYYSKKYNVPYVLQAHGAILPFFEKQKLKKIYDFVIGNNILQSASKLIAVSNVEIDQCNQMGINDNQIVLIPNGIDIDKFESLSDYGLFRKKYNLGGKKIILYLGRIHEIKGIDFLIKSYYELCNEIDDVILVLAGPDEYYKDKVENLIHKLNLETKVIFTGFIDGKDKIAAYIDADVLVYPSSYEVFGLVPFESLICGTPVIVSDKCGCGDLVKKAKCGLVTKYGDVNDLKKKMIWFIENPEKGDKLAKKGREYIENNLTWKDIIVDVEKLYEEQI